jgi:hypothetical protein
MGITENGSATSRNFGHRRAADSCKRLCSRCDAPQHEGAPRGKTNLRLQEMAAGSVPLFPDCYLQ